MGSLGVKSIVFFFEATENKKVTSQSCAIEENKGIQLRLLDKVLNGSWGDQVANRLSPRKAT